MVVNGEGFCEECDAAMYFDKTTARCEVLKKTELMSPSGDVRDFLGRGVWDRVHGSCTKCQGKVSVRDNVKVCEACPVAAPYFAETLNKCRSCEYYEDRSTREIA